MEESEADGTALTRAVASVFGVADDGGTGKMTGRDGQLLPAACLIRNILCPPLDDSGYGEPADSGERETDMAF